MKFVLYLIVMAGITYLIRMVPLVLIKKKIENKYVLSFLHYIPYAVLSAMTVPAIFTSTASTVGLESVISASFGFATALVLSYFEKSLLTVAASSCLAVFIVQVIALYIR